MFQEDRDNEGKVIFDEIRPENFIIAKDVCPLMGRTLSGQSMTHNSESADHR